MTNEVQWGGEVRDQLTLTPGRQYHHPHSPTLLYSSAMPFPLFSQFFLMDSPFCWSGSPGLEHYVGSWQMKGEAEGLSSFTQGWQAGWEREGLQGLFLASAPPQLLFCWLQDGVREVQVPPRRKQVL